MKILLIIVALLITLFQPAFAYDSPNANYPSSDPVNKQGWVKNAAFTDEFNGPHLDTAKWISHHWYWNGREPSEFVPANVSVSGGKLILKTQCLNKVVNGSFEAADLSAWPGSWGTTGVTSKAHKWGNQCAFINGDGGIAQTVKHLTPNTSYNLYVYGMLGPASVALTVGVTAYGGDEMHAILSDGTNWQQAHLSFTTGPMNTTAIISIENTGKTGVVYVDDVAVVPASLPQRSRTDSNYTTAACCVSSINRAPFGYYEAKMKVANAPNTSSFWMQNNLNGEMEEVDIEESWCDVTTPAMARRDMHMTTHYFHRENEQQKDTAVGQSIDLSAQLNGHDLSEDYHVFGADWEPTSITFYFDGKQVGRTIDNIYQQHPEYIFFDTELFPFNIMPASEYTTYTYIDYVRAWTKR